jgi:hypothetical protein
MSSGYIPRTDGYGTVRRLEFGKSLQGLREFFRRCGHVDFLRFLLRGNYLFLLYHNYLLLLH